MKTTLHYLRSTSFAMTALLLVAFLVAGAVGAYLFLDAAAGAVEAKRQYWVRLGMLSAGVALLSVVLLAGLVARYLAARLTDPEERSKPMPYLDLWAEAGRRLDPKDAPPVEPWEAPAEESSDTPPDDEPPDADEPPEADEPPADPPPRQSPPRR